MAKSAASTRRCPHCDASIAHLSRGCRNCGRRVPRSLAAPCRSCATTVDYLRGSCPACRASLPVWDGVIARVLRERDHVDLELAKELLPHPREVGFACHVGDPRGQRADYRRPLSDGRGIHVKEFADRFEVHWDRVDPTRDFLGHVLADAPHWLVFGGFLGAKLARWPVAATLGLVSHIKR